MVYASTTIVGPTVSLAITQAVENQIKGIGSEEGQVYLEWAMDAAQQLRCIAPDHPAALEAAVQVDMLVGRPLCSPDPM